MIYDFSLSVARLAMNFAIDLERAAWAIADGVSGKSVWDRRGWDSSN